MDPTKLRQAWVSFLLPHPWQLFLTLTFDRKRASPRHSVSPEWADKRFRQLIRFANERIYGKRWLRTTKHKGVIWARVDEAHADGVLHFHAVIYAPSRSFPESLVRAVKNWWERHFGMARIEIPRSIDDVLHYLTKHVAFPDHAEIQISNNFQYPE